MSKGRPKEFDETFVLERAMDQFWLHGYKGTAMSDLLEVMEISRQSLYDTFGSKRELFIRILEHYRATQLAAALALLERPGSRVENVKAVVGFFESLGSDPSCRGCLVANSVVEFGPSEDDQISGLLRDTLGKLQSAIEVALVEAQKHGELAASKSPGQLSRALTNAIIGMAVTGRLRLGQSSLREVYAGTLSMLD